MEIEERLLSQWDSEGKHSYAYTKSHLIEISLAELDKMSAFVIQMQDYAQGRLIPSRKLKNILNKDVRYHLSKVSDLKDYLIGNHVQEENIEKKLQNIILQAAEKLPAKSSDQKGGESQTSTGSGGSGGGGSGGQDNGGSGGSS